MTRMIRLLAGGVGMLALAWAGRGTAQVGNPPPASPFPNTPGVENPSLFQPLTPARPQTAYPLNARAGNWLICAASFTGPHAVYLADQCCRHLREKHNMAAYVFNYADIERRRQEEEWLRQQQANPHMPLRRRITRIEDQCAVLVGGWADMKPAEKALPVIKKLPPPTLTLPSGARYNQVVFIQGIDDRTGRTEIVGKGAANPFALAFVIRNPTAPKNDAAERDRPDPLWKKLNADEKYSLLKNKKKITLVIWEGIGAAQIQSAGESNNFLEKLAGHKSAEVMNAAGLQARELARFLRQYDIEAWVLHTRTGSLVTVGGFEDVNDEQCKRMQQRLATLRLPPGVLPTPLFSQPMPMKVPRL